jgi:hypothetical protein
MEYPGRKRVEKYQSQNGRFPNLINWKGYRKLEKPPQSSLFIHTNTILCPQ